jgi:hypothetical protein
MKSYTFKVSAEWKGDVIIHAETQDEAAKHIPDYIGYRAGFIPSTYDVQSVEEQDIPEGPKFIPTFKKGECC